MFKEVVFLRKGENACTHYRVDLPVKHLFSLGFKVSSVDSINLHNVVDKAYIFGRACLYSELNVFRDIKKRGGTVIYEIDDNLLDLPDWNPASAFYLKHQVVIRNFLREADFVIVTNECLKEAYHRYNPNIVIVDNYIDFDYLNQDVEIDLRNKEFKKVSIDILKDRFCLLWGGSTSHKADLKVLERGLIRFLKLHPDMLLIAIHTINKPILNQVSPDQIFLIPAVPPESYLALLHKLPANLGFAPLRNCPFNRCKSRLKAIEYMASGIVPVVSKVQPYLEILEKTLYDSLLVEDSDWFNVLENIYHLWEFSIIKKSISSWAHEHYDIKNSNWKEALFS